jgi:glycosyltransferase involved in cell wall biosynthesis
MTALREAPLRIAIVAPLWTRVPPARYGGTELIVHLLTEELVARGHDVTLFASGDSVTTATLRATCEVNLLQAMAQGSAYEYEPYANAAFAEVLRNAGAFDIIHCHLGAAQLPLAALSPTPVLYTLNNVPTLDEHWVLARHPEIAIAAISAHQAAALPPASRANARVIHHGIDFSAYEPLYERGGYLAFVARMSPQKSPVAAIEIAAAAGLPLVLAGAPQNESERAYFDQRVRPRIDGERVRYVGLVDHARKNELLKNAGALLFPIQDQEAFGLIMIEAMACGTPVLGWSRASVPEIVTGGETGFHGDSVEALSALVPAALELDRANVRAAAARRFGYRRMADNYVDAYRELVASLRAQRP